MGDATDADLVDAPPGCLGAGGFSVCPPASVPPNVFLLGSAGVFDTDTNVSCASQQPPGWVERGQPASCFVFGAQIVVAMDGIPLSVTGSRPLVIAATESITATGPIDVASHTGGSIGPGANAKDCDSFGTAGSGAGSAGGAGGSFGTIGGYGGDDGAALGGLPGPAIAPVTLHGGCPGQLIGSIAAPPSGAGGGVVYLTAGASITIHSGIDASGVGGMGGFPNAGGAGGGTGGMIVLIAPTVDCTGANLFADGGGGGAGGSSAPGSNGADPDGSTSCCTGGPSVVGGGGNGAHDGRAAGAGGSGGAPNSGGGGGGGAGYIMVQGTNLMSPSRSSPAAHF